MIYIILHQAYTIPPTEPISIMVSLPVDPEASNKTLDPILKKDATRLHAVLKRALPTGTYIHLTTLMLKDFKK